MALFVITSGPSPAPAQYPGGGGYPGGPTLGWSAQRKPFDPNNPYLFTYDWNGLTVAVRRQYFDPHYRPGGTANEDYKAWGGGAGYLSRPLEYNYGGVGGSNYADGSGLSHSSLKELSIKASKFSISTVHCLAVVATLAVAFCLMSTQRDNFGASPVSGMPPPSLNAQDENQIAQLHSAGLHGEDSQIPIIIDSLKNPPSPSYDTGYRQIALNALSRLAATEALPEIETIIQDKKYPYLINDAKVAKARILAESSVKGMTPGASQAANKISRFYAELGLNSTGINDTVADYKTQSSQPNGESRNLPAKLLDMDTHQSLYSAEAFSTLFRILGAIGDKTQTSVLKHFDDEAKLAYSQKRSQKTYGAYEVLNSVAFVKGYKRQIVSGF